MFAKQLPKILEGLGIKLDGDGKFTLNPLKKFEDSTAGGKKILGAARGVAAGAMVGTAGMLTGAGIGRGLSATVGGLKSGLQGKKFGEIRKDQVTKNAEMRRAISSGSSFWGRRGAQLGGYLGTPGRLGQIEHDKIATQNRIDDLNAQKKELDNSIAPVRRQIQEKSDVSSTLKAMQDRGVSKVKQGTGTAGAQYRSMLQDAAALDAQSQQATNPEEAARLAREAEAKRQAAETFANTTGRDLWINENMETDTELRNLRTTYNRQSAIAGVSNVFEGASADQFASVIDSQGKAISTDITAAKDSIAETEQRIKTLDEQVKTQQETIDELNAQEKTAKSNVEATHSTAGGPAHPSDIRPAESTVGRRTGGPGSGMGPMGPGGGPGGRP